MASANNVRQALGDSITVRSSGGRWEGGCWLGQRHRASPPTRTALQSRAFVWGTSPEDPRHRVYLTTKAVVIEGVGSAKVLGAAGFRFANSRD